nr:NlpC/P60 family protein [uncultured Faecalibacillus sp.]
MFCLKIKKYFVGFVASTMLVSTSYCIKPVEAIDFSKDEAKYMSLCASGKLTNSNKKTCEEFNSYLKAKNKKLKKNLENQKSAAASTTQTLDSVQKKLNSLNSDISSKEAEIQYVETSIQNTQADIDKDNQEIKDRMYIMQSYMNENTFINYIFGADNFTDMLSRIDSFNTLTSSDQDLIAQMLEKKKEIENQKVTLENAKAVLEEQKKEQAAIQVQYETLLEEQRKQIAATEVDANVAASRSNAIDASLAAFYEQSKKDDVGHVSQIPTPKPNPSNNNNQNSSNNNTSNSTNNSNSNANNNNSNNNSNSSSKPSQDSTALGIAIANKALSKQGKRYYWGASGPNYFDCSGLVYWAHNQAGVSIGRSTAAGYASSGKAVSYSHLQIGDVITFSYGSGVSHIGIYIGNGNMVHASGKGSETVGQDPNQCVKVTSVAPGSYFYSRIYNCRRLY